MINKYVLGCSLMAIMFFGNGCKFDCSIYNDNQTACQNEKNSNDSAVCNWMPASDESCVVQDTAADRCKALLSPPAQPAPAPDPSTYDAKSSCMEGGCVYYAAYALSGQDCVAPASCAPKGGICVQVPTSLSLRTGEFDDKKQASVCTYTAAIPDMCVNIVK
ncbi:MAG: hypothetical protein O2897_06450 [bacterium]|nr:hypothetical protein [bacterium]